MRDVSAQSKKNREIRLDKAALRLRAINMLLSIVNGARRENTQPLTEGEHAAFMPLDYSQIVRPLVLIDRRNGMTYYGIAIKYSITYSQAEWICKYYGACIVDDSNTAAP